MHIEDFKTWHWIVLGPIIGLLFGGVLLFQGTAPDAGGIDTLDQPHFERAASGMLGRRRDESWIGKEYAESHPLLTDLVVHPPIPGDKKGLVWVTGKVLGAELKPKDPSDPHSKMVAWSNWRKFRYGASSPYNAVVPKAESFESVIAYLDSIKANSSGFKVKYQYAWYEYTAATLILPATAGLLIIGIAWPLTINLMQRNGLAKLPTKKVKLPKRKATAGKAAAVDHSAGDQQLDQLNAQLEGDLAAGAGPSAATATATATAEAPVKVLTGAAEIAAAEAAEKERQIREFGGEFYPVAKTIHKESTDEHSKPPVPKPPTSTSPAPAPKPAAPVGNPATQAPKPTAIPPAPAPKPKPPVAAAPSSVVKPRPPILGPGIPHAPAKSNPPAPAPQTQAPKPKTPGGPAGS